MCERLNIRVFQEVLLPETDWASLARLCCVSNCRRSARKSCTPTSMTLRSTVARSTAVPPCRGRVAMLLAMIATAQLTSHPYFTARRVRPTSREERK